MKKTAVIFMTAAIVLTFGFVFSEESRADSVYNGITYFNMGQVSNCDNLEQTSAAGSETITITFNGITHFGPAVQEGAKGSCAGKRADEGPGKKPFNGITMF